MRVIKVLGIVVLVLVAFVGLSVYFTASNINHIVKQTIEQVGSEVLQTPVTLNSVDVRLTEGRAMLSGLAVKNLPDYQASNLFEMDQVVVDLNLEAILEKRIDLTEVIVSGMRIAAEQKAATTNIQQLLDRLPKGDKSTDTSPKQSGGESMDMKVRIGRFQFADSSASLVTEQWGEKELMLPTIELKNLGGEKGVPPEQLATAIFQPLLKQINTAAKRAVKDAVEGKVKEKLEEKESELKDKYRSKLKDKLGSDSDTAEGALKSMLSH